MDSSCFSSMCPYKAEHNSFKYMKFLVYQFHMPPHYDDHTLMMNVFLDTANINAFNISTLDLRMWQNFGSNWIPPHLQKQANVCEVPFTQLYRDPINTSQQTYLFRIKDEDKDPSFIWTILIHPGTYVTL